MLGEAGIPAGETLYGDGDTLKGHASHYGGSSSGNLIFLFHSHTLQVKGYEILRWEPESFLEYQERLRCVFKNKRF